MVPNSRPGATYLHLVKLTRNHTHCRIYLVVHGDDVDGEEEKMIKGKRWKAAWSEISGRGNAAYRQIMDIAFQCLIMIILPWQSLWSEILSYWYIVFMIIVMTSYGYSLSIWMFCRLCEIFFRSKQSSVQTQGLIGAIPSSLRLLSNFWNSAKKQTNIHRAYVGNIPVI